MQYMSILLLRVFLGSQSCAEGGSEALKSPCLLFIIAVPMSIHHEGLMGHSSMNP